MVLLLNLIELLLLLTVLVLCVLCGRSWLRWPSRWVRWRSASARGYSSPAIASLATPAELGGLAISAQQGSWVASLSLLGALVGSLPSGVALRLGRRRLLAAVSLPFAAAWWLAAGAGSLEALYAAAFISGLCSAVVALVTPVYVSEVAQPAVRGGLCAVTKVASNVGLLLSFLLGGALDWQQLALAASVAPLLLLPAACLVPRDAPATCCCAAESARRALRSSGCAVLRRTSVRSLRCSERTLCVARRPARQS